MIPNDPDYHKDLSPPPLSGRGFDEKLRRRIEEELDRKEEARRRKRLWLWPAIGCCCALIVGGAVWKTAPWGTDGQDVQAGEAAATAFTAASGEPAPAAVTVPEEASAVLRTGVLLGLREDLPAGSPENGIRAAAASRYRTLMIAPVEGRIQVAAEGSGILVPYGQKFWKIEPVTKTTDSDLIQVLAAYPAEKPMEALPAGKDNPEEQIIHSEKLVFAGNQYVSVAEQDQTTSDQFTSASGRVWVRRLNQLPGSSSSLTNAAAGAAVNIAYGAYGSGGSKGTTPAATSHTDTGYVSILDIYGEGAWDTLKGLSRSFADREPRSAPSGKNTSSSELSPAASAPADRAPLNQWTITRKPGRWTAQVAEPTMAMSDARNPSTGYRLLDFPTALPETVTAHDQVCCTWGQVRSLQPDAKDLLSSPLEDMMIILTDKELVVHPAGARTSGTKPLLRVPLKSGEKLVSAQWATGSYVAAWVEKTRKYLEPSSAAR